jgi:hypothetical protein
MMSQTIPRIDAAALLDGAHSGHAAAIEMVRNSVAAVGFMTLYNTPISADRVAGAIAAYAAFFASLQPKRRGMIWPKRDQIAAGAGQGLNRSIPMPTLITNRCLIVGLNWMRVIQSRR